MIGKVKILDKVIKGLMVFLVFFMGMLVVFLEISFLGKQKPEVLGLESAPITSKVGLGGQENLAEVREVVLADDARLMLINNYLEKYKSPLEPYAELILELSDTYEFDYRWILAIGQMESNLCKKTPQDSYNCWGYGIHSKGTLRFESYELALKSFAAYLKKEYFDKGYKTPEEVMGKYCPHSNGSWARGINQFFADIELGK